MEYLNRQPCTQNMFDLESIMENLNHWQPDYSKIVLRLQKWLQLGPFEAPPNFRWKLAA